MSIRVVIADNDTEFRHNISILMKKHCDFYDMESIEVVGEAGDGHIALHQVREMSPDVLITGLNMSDLNGRDLISKTKDAAPGIKLIAISTRLDLQYILGIFKAGASAYLLKNCSYEDISRAISAVTVNNTYLSAEVAGIMINSFIDKPTTSNFPAFSMLTENEQNLFLFIAEGKSKKQIASLLKISNKTVETYRRRLMDKLNVSNVVTLTKYAIREGLIEV